MTGFNYFIIYIFAFILIFKLIYNVVINKPINTRGTRMKKTLITMLAIALFAPMAMAQQEADLAIILKKPQLKKGKPVMQALSERKSTRQFSAKGLDNQTLSNLLWAATGINRADGKRTNPTAMNRQEIDVYACLPQGAYLYNVKEHSLTQISKEDCRLVGAPVTLFIVVNNKDLREYDYVDAGIVSQNISLFASGMGLVTVPRGQMPKEQIAKALALTKDQHLILNHPVGYEIPKDKK